MGAPESWAFWKENIGGWAPTTGIWSAELLKKLVGGLGGGAGMAEAL